MSAHEILAQIPQQSRYPLGEVNLELLLGSFWWKSIIKLIPEFKQMARATIQNGDSILFWQDDWGSGKLTGVYPELFSFTINQHISVRDFISSQDQVAHFHTPLSVEALQQLQLLQHSLQDITLTNDQDKWSYPWNSSSYSSIKMYIWCTKGPAAAHLQKDMEMCHYAQIQDFYLLTIA